MESNHYQIIESSLSEEREVDEQTFVSLAILNERLERLKKLGGCFTNISFSPAVEELATFESLAAIS